ncbi:MAG TPA: hypothetical protein VFS21_34510 [Roseiflexaceae bacterium]|nr:hypothetical protein [Roseiflexaceae bacterium]
MAEGEPRSSITLLREGSQLLLNGFPVLGLPDAARAVKYFSLNPFLPDADNRCPLACVYCVCHQDSSWHHHPERFAGQSTPSDLLSALLDAIFATPEGRRGVPISLCDYSDPFIPAHRERVLGILDALIDRGAANMVYITTKVHPGRRFLERLSATLSRPHALRPTVFVSLPPLLSGYEQVSIGGRVRLIKELVALGIPCCWYLRPLAEPWYDEELMWRLARELVPHVRHHIVLSGVVMSEEIADLLERAGLIVPEWDRAQPGRKVYLRPAFEQRLRSILGAVAEEQGVALGPVMGHRLCGTNGNHAYGCLSCGKQHRYCQLFQVHHYGRTVEREDSGQLQALLHGQQRAMLAGGETLPLTPTEEECV